MAAAVGLDSQRLLFLFDRHSGVQFLVDTGAEVSVVPATSSELRSGLPGVSLRAANGTPIRTYGSRKVSLSINGRLYSWPFIVADVDKPLLGADFFCHHGPLVDMRGRQLVDAITFAATPLAEAPGRGPIRSIVHVATENPYAALLAQFPALTTPTFSRPSTVHGVEHFIHTSGPPVHARARRLPPNVWL